MRQPPTSFAIGNTGQLPLPIDCPRRLTVRMAFPLGYPRVMKTISFKKHMMKCERSMHRSDASFCVLFHKRMALLF